MLDLNDLRLFAKVVEHKGFAAAGRAMGVPKSRLSRRVAELEQHLGVRLIQRSSRRFAVTEIGQEFFAHCLAMLVEAEAAAEVIDRSRSAPQGTVRVSCPPALVCFQIGDMVARFMAAHPRVAVHLESTGRRVDPINEGIDVAIRVRFPPLEPTDHVMRVLGNSAQRMVASPTLLAAHKPVTVPADLASLPSVDFGPPQRDFGWQLGSTEDRAATVPHRPRLVTDDIAQLRSAAVLGVGVARLPLMVVGDDIAAGRLVEVLPSWRPRSGIVHAVFPTRRGLLPAVRALIDHLGKEYASLGDDSDRSAPAPAPGGYGYHGPLASTPEPQDG